VSTPPSAEQRFLAKLQPFHYGLAPDGEDARGLREALAGLPPIPAESAPDAPTLMEKLAQREARVRETLAAHHGRRMAELVRDNLAAPHAFTILFRRARLIDALHQAVFAVAVEELPALVALRRADAEKELEFKRSLVPRKREKLANFQAQLPVILAAEGDDPARRAYFVKVGAELEKEAAEAEQAVAALATALPSWRAFRADPAETRRRVALFARGGYGRAELSFASDLDTGWCVDTRGLAPGQAEIYRELILRAESLLHEAGVETVHQYFELDEDLSRFAAPETLHTIPSVLEGRLLAGNPEVLDALKRRFLDVLPVDLYLREKVAAYEASPRPTLTAMDLKEDFGGLRSVQIPLWIMAALHAAPSMMTADLLLQARALGFLSLHEAAALLEALELLYELRNFCAAAERHYYDQEARDSNCVVAEFVPDRIDDALARLYLFRKRRFASVDAFDSCRLRLVDEVQRLSRALLDRVLDRTHAYWVGGVPVAVHLGRKEITAIGGAACAQPGAPAGLPAGGQAVLTLAEFIANTGYRLSPAVQDALAGVVDQVAPAADPVARREQARQWSNILRAPHADVALSALWSVRDPLQDTLETLLGRFLPELNRMVFLLRNIQMVPLPLHQHLLRSLDQGQQRLDALRESHPELYQLLGTEHVLALKWSLLLHAGCALEGATDNPTRSAELAAELLARLGSDDAMLERRVRLLVEHHKTVVALAKSASYADQALTEYFTLAERDIIAVVLLYLVNAAVLRANGERFQADVQSLDSFFEEAARIFAEFRGLPSQDESRALINAYFNQRKEELRAETRIHLLLQRSQAVGVAGAILEPVQRDFPKDWERLEPKARELTALQREIVLGNRPHLEQERLAGKFVQLVRQYLGGPALHALTAEQNTLFSWFFAAFPNRYLLAMPPRQLSQQMTKFTAFASAPVLVDIVTRPEGGQALLIATRLPRSHTHVAYALSRRRINIVVGKVNRLLYPDRTVGYGYFFQVSPLPGAESYSPRDLEFLIEHEEPPSLGQPPPASPYQRKGVRVEFLGVDESGYEVAPAEGEFIRRAARMGQIRVIMRDQPFLFYKVTQVFERFQAEILQALITTTGNQVQDYFFVSPEDYDRLRATHFEEFLINRMSTGVMESAE
jgi:UTP:GlnB (protein PII) uridylyltransferase